MQYLLAPDLNYGYDNNCKIIFWQSCLLLQDMFDWLEKVLNFAAYILNLVP
jgi:hypothetical protein